MVHNRNWRALALDLRDEGSAKSALPCRGRRKTGGGKAQAKGRERAKHEAWQEAVRFVAVSQDGAGAFLNAIPRDDMRMETWAMRLSVLSTSTSRRCCQRPAAGPQYQTQVHASTTHSRPTRRVGHRCANGADSPPRSELQQTTRRGCGQHWLARQALLRSQRPGRLFPQQQRGARSEGRFCRFRQH